MLFKILFILTILSIGSTNSDEEAIVETVGDDEETTNYIYSDAQAEEDSRQGRLMYSYRQNPIINIMLQTAAPTYVPKNPNDIFDFLRDSFPLPGGELNIDLVV